MLFRSSPLAKGLGEIRQALAERSALSAVATRRNVLDQYPEFASLPELHESLAETTALEQELTVRVDSDADPVDMRDEAVPADFSAAKVVFAAHAHSIGAETSGERIIWSHAKGSCFALDANNGKILWRRPTGWQQPFFPVEAAGVREGVLLYADVSDNSGQLLFLTRDQGTVLWALTVRNDRPVGQPLIHENQIYLATQSGRLLRIDLDTGVLNDELRFTQRLATGPILLQDDESLVLAGEDAFLYTCSTRPLDCRVLSFLDHRGWSLT